MSTFLPQITLLAVGGSIVPPKLLLTNPFLGSRRPLTSATALALGYLTTCAAMGIAGLALFGRVAGAGGVASMVGRSVGATLGGLPIVLGLRSLLKTPDADAQWPGCIASSSMSPSRAFGFGMAHFPIQIKNLAIFVACLELIAVASLGPRGSAVALGLVLLVFALPVLGFIALYAAMPQRASTVMGSLRVWMEKNSRAITVVLCFVFGSVLPDQRPLGTLGPWVMVPGLRRARSTEPFLRLSPARSFRR
jgi:Sap-like sulfolipid-1-addressing protein